MTLIHRLESAEKVLLRKQREEISRQARKDYRAFVSAMNRVTDRELSDAALLKALETQKESQA